MGCWLGTCGLTRLPIYAGDPVYGLIIIKKPWLVGKLIPRGTNASGLCSVTDEWELASPLFEGKYDDYGCIDDFPSYDQTTRDTILGAITPKLLPSSKFSGALQEEDVMSRYDGTVEETAQSFEGLLAMIERERAFYVNEEDIVLPLGLWMAHKAIVERLLNLYPNLTNAQIGMVAGVKYDIISQGLFSNTVTLLRCMGRGRIALMPQAGKGSQDGDFIVHRLLADFVLSRQKRPWE